MIDDSLSLGLIQSYTDHGGLTNPEMMDHEKVRNMVMICRDEIISLRETLTNLYDGRVIALPKNPHHAKVMLLIAENYLKPE
jgi:hypothetical protein